MTMTLQSLQMKNDGKSRFRVIQVQSRMRNIIKSGNEKEACSVLLVIRAVRFMDV